MISFDTFLSFLNFAFVPIIYYIRLQEKTISSQDKRLAVLENDFNHIEQNIRDEKELFKNHITQYNENTKLLFDKIAELKEDIHKIELKK